MKLYLSTAPHIRSGANTQVLMRDVLIALLPTTVAGIYYFGLSAAMVIAVSILSCVLFELRARNSPFPKFLAFFISF